MVVQGRSTFDIDALCSFSVVAILFFVNLGGKSPSQPIFEKFWGTSIKPTNGTSLAAFTRYEPLFGPDPFTGFRSTLEDEKWEGTKRHISVIFGHTAENLNSALNQTLRKLAYG